MDNIIKSLFPQTCPHCKKDIIIAIQTSSPAISEIMTEENVFEAKNKVKEAAKEILNGKNLEETISWVEDENTIFGLKDVDAIISSLKK